MRQRLILGGLVLALAVPLGLVAQKERVRARGTRLLLALAPVDPRSLIQGDYMVLEYALIRGLPDTTAWPRDGHLVLAVSPEGVGTYVRRDDRTPLAPGELRIRYRKRDGGRIRLGAEAYHFQEGHAGLYEAARYGELRVTGSGAALLVGLADEARRSLGPGALRSGLDRP